MKPLPRIKKNDIISFAIGLSGLLFIGFSISLLILLLSHNQGMETPPRIEGPANFFGWAVVLISCLGTGYLEETYFRYYLLTKLQAAGPQTIRKGEGFTIIRVIFSAFLFSTCHMYEGLWGVINAFLAGILLSLLFIRFRSLHGIAWAHGAYNIVVYIMGSFGSGGA
jgi:membrane protease YdiL (CAAX protease family)